MRKQSSSTTTTIQAEPGVDYRRAEMSRDPYLIDFAREKNLIDSGSGRIIDSLNPDSRAVLRLRSGHCTISSLPRLDFVSKKEIKGQSEIGVVARLITAESDLISLYQLVPFVLLSQRHSERLKRCPLCLPIGLC